MAGTGHNNYGGRALANDLKAQGFKVAHNRKRIIVESPTGVKQFFHDSSFMKGVPGIIAELKGMGFKFDPSHVGATAGKNGGRTFTQKNKPKQDCKAEGCTYSGKPLNIGRHIEAVIKRRDQAHIDAYPEKAEKYLGKASDKALPEPPKKRKPRGVTVSHDPDHPVVRMRNKVEQLRRARELEAEAVDWIVESYESVVAENKRIGSKLKDLERTIGKLVDRI